MSFGNAYQRAVLSYVNGGFSEADFSGDNLFVFGLPTNPTAHTFGSPKFDGYFLGGCVESQVAGL